MAKENARRLAHSYYVDQGKSGKEVAKLAGVTEATISAWVKRYGWSAERNARANSYKEQVANLKLIISNIAEQRLALILQIKEAKEIDDKAAILDLTKEAARLDDAASKWNKTLEKIDKENKVTLSVYLSCMEQIFKSLQAYDHTLYIGTLDFQENHVHEVSVKLG